MARMTLGQIMSRPSTIDWDKVNATTEADIARHAAQDGTESQTGLSMSYPAPATVRRSLGLTQKAIAELAGVPLATWQNWEQGRVSLDPAVRTLLKVLLKEPEAVRRAVAA